MPDFKLTVTNADDPPTTGDDIMDLWGDDYDADNGDFRVVVESDRSITIYVHDVAQGDIKDLTAHILDEFDTVFVTGSRKENGTWFPTDVEA